MVRALILSSLLAVPLAAGAGTTVLSVGNTPVQFPEEDGYVALSAAFPRAFELSSAALPASNRLVEEFVTLDDLNRMRKGGSPQQPYFQVQTLRKLESRDISVAEWKAAEPAFSAGMSRAATDTSATNVAKHASADMSKVSGQRVDVSIGNVAKPTIYRETPTSIRFDLQAPVYVTINGVHGEATMLGACAITLMRNRLVYVYVFGNAGSGNTFARLNKQLDTTLDRMSELNPDK